LRVKDIDDNSITVSPDAIEVYGENIVLEVIDMKKEVTPSGFRYLVDSNLPIKAKVLCGEDDSSLSIISTKKNYSTNHILPVGFPLEENLDYYVCQVVVRSEDAQELELPVDVLKWTRSGFDIMDYDLEVSAPKVTIDALDNRSTISIHANKSIHFRVSKKLFKDDSWQIAYLPEQDDFNHVYKASLSGLELNTTHFIKIEGETDATGIHAEKFEDEFKFYLEEKPEIEEVVVEEPLVNEAGEELDEVFFKDENTNDVLIQALSEEFSTKELSDFIPSVESLISEGVLKGNGNKLYPYRDITRAEFASLICRASGFELDEDPSAFFTDVSSTHFSFACLSKLVEKQIIKGFGDGTFRPDDTISRAGALTVLSRAFNLDLPTEYTNDNFKDINKDYDLWMYVESVFNQGWLSGDYIRPNDNLKRAEAFDWIAISFGFVDSKVFKDVDSNHIEPIQEEVQVEEGEVVSEVDVVEEVVAPIEKIEPPVVVETPIVESPNEPVETIIDNSEDEELSSEDEDLMKLLEGLL
jgi:hypothetical protein